MLLERLLNKPLKDNFQTFLFPMYNSAKLIVRPMKVKSNILQAFERKLKDIFVADFSFKM